MSSDVHGDSITYDSSDHDDSLLLSDQASDDEMQFLSEQEGPASAPAKSHSWTIIDRRTLEQVQDEALSSVQAILGCNRSVARVLLIHFQWNKEALFGTLADRCPEQVYAMAGVTSRSAGPAAAGTASAAAGPGLQECQCCFCDAAPAAMTAMACGHAFCHDCWRGHFRVQISEGNSKRIRCMATGCGAICDEARVRGLLSADAACSHLLSKFSSRLLESYVEDNKQARWCPSIPHCGWAVQAEGDIQCEPHCKCGLSFCFACGDRPHSPCTCEMWRQWRRKCSDDSETQHWLTANTKPCPKCSNQVEKNGGCNLVVCRCGQAFCWLCGAATGRLHTWEAISGHSCGRYRDDANNKVGQAQRDLQRFMHYNLRWEAHEASQKLEAKQAAAIQAKMKHLESNMVELQDSSWLEQALQQLFNARRILGYTYVAAFFLFGNVMFAGDISEAQNSINQQLFEDQQQQLEAEVERLSKLIETDVDAMEQGLRTLVINSTNNIDKRLVKLYELLENDLLSQITGSMQNVAPYKGESMLKSDGATLRLGAAATPSLEVVDVTRSPSPPEPQQGRRASEHGPDKRARVI